MALVAHIDSGKTTLTESILLRSEYISSSGSVDTGSTTTDFLPVERERGITVQSASVPVKWKDWTFNLIDTPGHADFGMEVESASRVVDGAVVLIDSVEGVEAQTCGVWKQLDRYNVATRIMYFNKLDRPGASFRSCVLSVLANRLHPNPTTLVLPIASFDPEHYARGDPGLQGLVDLVSWDVWKWDESGNASCFPLPRRKDDLNTLPFLAPSHPIIPHLVPARIQLLENLSMFSNELMERLLDLPPDPSSYLSLSTTDLMPYLRQATLRHEILPILCGSAVKNVGTNLVMDYIGQLLASPVDVPHNAQGENVPLRVLAWKVNWDSRRGWMTFVRVYSGKLTPQRTLFNTTRNERERVSKLFILHASDIQEVTELPFGSIGVILGLRHTRTGDTLVAFGPSNSESSVLPDITLPAAVMSASIIPQSHSDLEPVQQALAALARTDPSIRYDIQEGQLLVHGLGALHLEIIEGRLRDEWNVRFEYGRHRVSYREGMGHALACDNWTLWETTLAEKRITYKLPLNLRPLEPGEEGDPAWDGNVVVDEQGCALRFKEAVRASPLWYILEGIASALSASPHSSLALSRVRVQVNPIILNGDFPASLLTGAAAMVLRRRFQAVGMGPIMEPYSLLKVSVPESKLGKVMQDISENGGEIRDLDDEMSTFGAEGTDKSRAYSDKGVYVTPAWMSPSGTEISNASQYEPRTKRIIRAIVPLSRFLDYSSRLRALSEGNGFFELVNERFRQVSEARKREILREIGKA